MAGSTRSRFAAAGVFACAAPLLYAQAPLENLVYVPLPPCRVLDSRVATDPAFAGRLAAGASRTFVLRDPDRDYSGQGGSATGCGVPGFTGAGGGLRNEVRALAVNVVAVSPLGAGHLNAWAAGETEPSASVVNFQLLSPGLNIANGVILPVCAEVGAAPCTAGELTFRAHGSAVHLLADVVGFFRPLAGGSASGLDADLLDGLDSSDFAPSAHDHDAAYVNAAGDTVAGTLALQPAAGVALTTAADVDLRGRMLRAGVPFLSVAGISNTVLGLEANGDGGGNTVVGAGAMANNTNGFDNTVMGKDAMRGGNGSLNTVVGTNAMMVSQGATQNTAIGISALTLNGAGERNTVVGYAAGETLSDQSRNTAVGAFARLLGGGSDNIAVGYEAGYSFLGNHNILIGNHGVPLESATIRIGEAPNQTRFFAAGVSGAAVSGAPVVVDADGQLGVAPSTRAMKDEIQDMQESSHGLYQLRPVTFRYKEAVAGAKGLQYGLIAEEVAAVYPDLIQYGPDGRPQTILYHLLTPMLLNELQQQQARLEAQEREIRVLREKIEGLVR